MGSMPAGQFLLMWFSFLVLMLVALSGILLWAVRSRQFSDQDRARYLPLDEADREAAGYGTEKKKVERQEKSGFRSST